MLYAHSLNAQNEPFYDEFGNQVQQQIEDDLSDTTSTIPAKRNTFLTIFSGNPGKAALFSLAVPGGGQIYNRKWWKLPLVYGLEGAAIYNVYLNASRYKQYDGIFDKLVAGGSDPFFISPSDVKPIRDAYRQRKEYAYVYAIIAHVITVFDAYVDRHLIEFDIDEDISMPIQKYQPSSPYLGISFTYRL